VEILPFFGLDFAIDPGCATEDLEQLLIFVEGFHFISG
jgi:hypothetical protein